MRKEKTKNSFSVMQTLPFLVLWIAGQAGAWIAAFSLYDTIYRAAGFNYSLIREAWFFGMVPGTITAIVQLLLVERGLKKKMRGWIPASLAGAFVSAFVYYAYASLTVGSERNVYLTVAALFLPLALGQAVWLRQRVKNSWLWVMGALVSVAMFLMPITLLQTAGITQFLVIGLSGILQGAVTGSVMRHLWLQPGATDAADEKAKNNLTLDEQLAEAQRLQRLDDAARESEQPAQEPLKAGQQSGG